MDIHDSPSLPNYGLIDITLFAIFIRLAIFAIVAATAPTFFMNIFISLIETMIIPNITIPPILICSITYY